MVSAQAVNGIANPTANWRARHIRHALHQTRLTSVRWCRGGWYGDDCCATTRFSGGTGVALIALVTLHALFQPNFQKMATQSDARSNTPNIGTLQPVVVSIGDRGTRARIDGLVRCDRDRIAKCRARNLQLPRLKHQELGESTFLAVTVVADDDDFWCTINDCWAQSLCVLKIWHTCN